MTALSPPIDTLLLQLSTHMPDSFLDRTNCSGSRSPLDTLLATLTNSECPTEAVVEFPLVFSSVIQLESLKEALGISIVPTWAF